MLEDLVLLYPWLKVGHLVFMLFWMAGLFMLPRFFIYHQEAIEGSEEVTRWVERETRLRRIILTPSLIATWGFGIALAFATSAWDQGWFHLKLLLVLALTGYHGWMVGYAKKLARGERTVSGKTLRIANEVPGIAAILIISVVVVVRLYI